MDLSLLQFKEQAGEKKEQKLILPPFINTYAEQTIDPNLKNEVQSKLCKYYVGILKEIYKLDYRHWHSSKFSVSPPHDYSSDSIKGGESGDITPRSMQKQQDFLNELRMKLIRHETNIWACIFRISKSDKQIQFEELDIPQTANQPRQRRHSVLTPQRPKFQHFKIEKRERKKSSGDAESENSEKLEEEEGARKSFKDLMKATGSRLRRSLTPSQIIEEEAS